MSYPEGLAFGTVTGTIESIKDGTPATRIQDVGLLL